MPSDDSPAKKAELADSTDDVEVYVRAKPGEEPAAAKGAHDAGPFRTFVGSAPEEKKFGRLNKAAVTEARARDDGAEVIAGQAPERMKTTAERGEFLIPPGSVDDGTILYTNKAKAREAKPSGAGSGQGLADDGTILYSKEPAPRRNTQAPAGESSFDGTELYIGHKPTRSLAPAAATPPYALYGKHVEATPRVTPGPPTTGPNADKYYANPRVPEGNNLVERASSYDLYERKREQPPLRDLGPSDDGSILYAKPAEARKAPAPSAWTRESNDANSYIYYEKPKAKPPAAPPPAAESVSGRGYELIVEKPTPPPAPAAEPAPPEPEPPMFDPAAFAAVAVAEAPAPEPAAAPEPALSPPPVVEQVEELPAAAAIAEPVAAPAPEVEPVEEVVQVEPHAAVVDVVGEELAPHDIPVLEESKAPEPPVLTEPGVPPPTVPGFPSFETLPTELPSLGLLDTPVELPAAPTVTEPPQPVEPIFGSLTNAFTNPEYATETVDMNLGFVVSEFNYDITSAMLERAKAHAEFLGAKVKHVVRVPGTFDMGLAVKKLLQRRDVDAVVTLGAVIQGETDHDDIVIGHASRKIADLSIEFGKPVALGITGPGMTRLQALERVDRAKDAVEAVVKLHQRLKAIDAA